MNIVALDPGKFNFAWCIVSPKGKLIHYGMLLKTFDFMKSEDIRSGMNLLAETAYKVSCLSGNIKHVVFERFVPRGMNRGNLSEIVNFSIGVFLSHLSTVNVIPVMASGWKVWTRNRFSDFTNKTIPIHVLDCYQMALYTLAKEGLSVDVIAKKRKFVNNKNYHWKFTKGVWVENGR